MGELRAVGIEPIGEEFCGARSLAERLLVHVIVAAAGAAVIAWSPLATLVLGTVALVSLIAEQSTRGVWLSWPVCRSRSMNVCGKLVGPSPPRRRVVLCAHYDTQHSGWIWAIHRRMEGIGFRSPLLLKPPLLPVVGLMAAQAVLGAIAMAIGIGAVVTALDGVVVVLYVVLAVLLIQWALGRPVPGAADNASGVAAVLAIAEEWRTNPPADDADLLVVLSGCEESGMLGAAAWADAHGDELQRLPTTFLNVDGIGFGPPRVLGAEVPAAGSPIRADPAMLELCRQIAQDMGLSNVGPHALPGPTDGLAFLARGMRGVTIVGFKGSGVLPNYHTFRDTSENMDWESAYVGLEFLRRVSGGMALH
jgi:hypothetical protein